MINSGKSLEIAIFKYQKNPWNYYGFKGLVNRAHQGCGPAAGQGAWSLPSMQSTLATCCQALGITTQNNFQEQSLSSLIVLLVFSFTWWTKFNFLTNFALDGFFHSMSNEQDVLTIPLRYVSKCVHYLNLIRWFLQAFAELFEFLLRPGLQLKPYLHLTFLEIEHLFRIFLLKLTLCKWTCILWKEDEGFENLIRKSIAIDDFDVGLI